METPDWLVEQFEANRGRLRAVAYGMLGSATDAEDAVQEAWLRLQRSDTNQVDNLAGWLTTVVARVSLDVLRSRQAHCEDPVDSWPDEPESQAPRPEDEALLADSLGPALLIVLDTLAPGERLAFVLHDMFAVPFDEIADMLDRSPAAVRQMASRARRRVQGVSPLSDADGQRQRRVVAAFLSASRNGDFGSLLSMLHPDVELHADRFTVRAGASPEVLGAHAVAETFAGRAKAARLALVEGTPGAVWSVGGRPRVVFLFSVSDGRITQINMLADPARLAELDIEVLT